MVLPASGPWLEAGAEFRGYYSAAFSIWSISYSWSSPASIAYAAPASSASFMDCSASWSSLLTIQLGCLAIVKLS